MSIKKFISFWISGLACCFMVLAWSQITSTNKLQAMNGRGREDSHAIELSHLIENAILSEQREDLLWRATADQTYITRKAKVLERATPLISELSTVDSDAFEKVEIAKIQQLFTQYRDEALADPPPPLRKVSRSADRVIGVIDAYMEHNRAQLNETLALSKELDATVDRWSIALILFVLLFTVFGSVLLLKRIILPTVALSLAARRFGQGESAVRATVYNNDELGMLSRAFNEMTENIALLQQERGHFIASLAHDIKNPVVLIGGTARRLHKKQAVAEEKLPLLNCIIEQADAVEELIGELVDTVRLEEGNIALSMAEVDLHELLAAIHAKQATMITSHRLSYEGVPCLIWGDARRLERVITNLLSNAVKYSAPNSAVDIRLCIEQDRGVIRVKDAGVGIPPEKIPTLFKPFRRLAHTSKMAKGSGLGLFSAKKIIDGHGGTIIIDSEPGRGTTVKVELPLHHGAPDHD